MALMSMVGYILGLGDRHPSNIMMSRETGSICHIDFGDCFEVAMHREKFPEKYPFRLTRMLVKAMEASGIEGTYRSTCETVMSLLRQNKDSLMAILEAFVHDPLINWRLKDTENAPTPHGEAAMIEENRLETHARGSENSANMNSVEGQNPGDRQMGYTKESKESEPMGQKLQSIIQSTYSL